MDGGEVVSEVRGRVRPAAGLGAGFGAISSTSMKEGTPGAIDKNFLFSAGFKTSV